MLKKTLYKIGKDHCFNRCAHINAGTKENWENGENDTNKGNSVVTDSQSTAIKELHK